MYIHIFYLLLQYKPKSFIEFIPNYNTNKSNLSQNKNNNLDYITKISELEKLLKDEKIKSQNLINDNNTLKNNLTMCKKENSELKERINKLIEEKDKLLIDLTKANKIISNFQKKNDNEKINIINNLKNELQIKEKEINELKLKLSNNNKKKQYVDYENIMVVNFISGDGKINEGIKCLETETFAEVEEKLYKKYDEYRETNNIFISGGNAVLRFKKMCENNIKDGDKIQLIPPA